MSNCKTKRCEYWKLLNEKFDILLSKKDREHALIKEYNSKPGYNNDTLKIKIEMAKLTVDIAKKDIANLIKEEFND